MINLTRLLEQLTNLVVGRLFEAGVPQSHCSEWLGRAETQHLVGLSLEQPDRLRRSDGHRNDDTRWLLFPHRLNRCPHGETGRQTIVDENHRAPTQQRRSVSGVVMLLAPCELPHFLRDHRIDSVTRHSQATDQIAVEHLDPARRERAHRHLALTGNADLSHDEYVKRCIEDASDFVSDGNTASGQRKHHRMLGLERQQSVGQHSAGFATIKKKPLMHVAIECKSRTANLAPKNDVGHVLCRCVGKKHASMRNLPQDVW